MKRGAENPKAEPPAFGDQPTTDAEWAAEDGRRELELTEGRVEPVTLEAVLGRLRAWL